MPGWRRELALQSGAGRRPFAATPGPVTITCVGESIPGWKPRATAAAATRSCASAGRPAMFVTPKPDVAQLPRAATPSPAMQATATTAADRAVGDQPGRPVARRRVRVGMRPPALAGAQPRPEERPAEDRERGGHEGDRDGHRRRDGDARALARAPGTRARAPPRAPPGPRPGSRPPATTIGVVSAVAGAAACSARLASQRLRRARSRGRRRRSR